MKIALVVILCTCIVIMTLSSSCSVVGYGIGSALDSPSYTISDANEQVEEIEKGREITVYLKNGATKKGNFFGLEINYPDSIDNRPLKSIWMQKGEQQIYININDVESIYISSAGEQKYIGLGIGAAIDITYIIIFLSGMATLER